MRPRRLIFAGLGVAVVLLVVVPVAWAASDLYSNLGPGGQVSPSVDRYPLGNYVLDSHFSAVKASLTGGVDASGIPSMIAFFLANLLWQITAFLANAVIELFALAFSVDLLNGSPNTAGAGALAPVGDAIHNLYANTLGQPWMELAVLLAGCWAMWRALVQRRYAETVSALSMSLVFCLLAMAVVAKPDATIGQASHWTNEISSAFLSVTAHGQVTDGPSARRAASDQLFDLLVFRPWVALQFGGTEHCIQRGTGSQQHDPQSVAVRPLATDPDADAKARDQLHRDGHLTTATKECVDNTVRYPDHFLRYAPGSDDRDAEYDAINNADPTKLPDSDPTKNTNTYRPAVVDKPVTDAMEKGGQYQRLLLALVILAGEVGALLLLGSLCVSVLLAQMVVLLLAAFAPVALVAAIIPGRGHELFKTWAAQLATYLVRKAAYSLVLAVLLAVIAALQDATTNLGWLLSFILQSMLMWMVFLHRHKLAGQLTAAVTGQQPGHDAQLRKLLGVAYIARQVKPAHRRPRPHSTPTDHDPDPDPAPETETEETPESATAPDEPPTRAEPSRGGRAASREHRRPSARRDHGGNDRPAEDTQALEHDDHDHSVLDEEDKPVRSARRHAARAAARRPEQATGDQPPRTEHDAAHDRHATGGRRDGGGRARPSAEAAQARPHRAHEEDDPVADMPPEAAADEPPSLADELRADQARRPAPALGQDDPGSDGDDAEPGA
jgi:hypothetical protein